MLELKNDSQVQLRLCITVNTAITQKEAKRKYVFNLLSEIGVCAFYDDALSHSQMHLVDDS